MEIQRTVSRIENGEKQFAEMTKFLHERALIEEMYCNKLKEWSMKWGRQLERSTEYNTGMLLSNILDTFLITHFDQAFLFEFQQDRKYASKTRSKLL